MFQKLIDKFLNPYLTSKIQRIGFLIALVSISTGSWLWVYLDDYEDSNALTMAFAGFLLGIYLVYIHHKVDLFVNSQDKVEIQVPTNLISKASSSSKKILSSNTTHYVIIFLGAFIYAALREIWVGNFNSSIHRLDLFIASSLGATIILGGIPVLFGKYSSILWGYVILIMMLTFNAFDALDEKKQNEEKIVIENTLKKYKKDIVDLNRACLVRAELSTGACKSNFVSNVDSDAICNAGVVSLVSNESREFVDIFLKNPKVSADISTNIDRLTSILLKGGYAPSTPESNAMAALSGSVKHKVASDCKILGKELSVLIDKLANDVRLKTQQLNEANIHLK